MMDYSKLANLVATILECDVSTLSLDSGLSHHELWDSLKHVEIMAFLKEECNIHINERNIGKLTTIEKILKYINEGIIDE